MAAQLIDGKKISQQRIEAVAQAVKARQEKGLHTPCLAVVLVGDDPASAVYVRNKKLTCQKSGIESRSYELPSETTQDDLLKLVDELNGDPASTVFWCNCRCRHTSTAKRFWNVSSRIKMWTASTLTTSAVWSSKCR